MVGCYKMLKKLENIYFIFVKNEKIVFYNVLKIWHDKDEMIMVWIIYIIRANLIRDYKFIKTGNLNIN